MIAPDHVDSYAVVGHPVSHSLSPRIHTEFAAQTGQKISYRAIELAVDSFSKGIRDLQQQGFSGLNVTVPFKREAWELCDERSPRATDAGAVNTLTFQPDGSIAGDNTDGVGLVRDLLDNLQVAIENQRILVLGAGGAVRGVLGPILAHSPACVVIANRTLEKAITLVRDFGSRGELDAVAYEALGSEKFDLIINGTAAGLDNEVPPLTEAVMSAGTACYDMMYNLSAATAFVDWAQAHGAAKAFDGIGMLVEQAAEAFLIWRNVRPDTTAVIDSLGKS
ncbi:MAG: shikimate dehydrogenase [Gammaproteobacteria bacterium]|nr:shikimate dehydrogenase [Gammaproteobacteria bacterium]